MSKSHKLTDKKCTQKYDARVELMFFFLTPPAFLHFLSPLSSPLWIFPLNEKRQLEGWWTLQITLFLFLFYFVFAFLLIPIKTRYVARASLLEIGLVPARRRPSALSRLHNWDSLTKKPWNDVVFSFDERANCTLVSESEGVGWLFVTFLICSLRWQNRWVDSLSKKRMFIMGTLCSNHQGTVKRHKKRTS